MLTSLLRVIPKNDNAQPEVEDIFTSALGLVFTDDTQNCLGDVDHLVAYKSRRLRREILLETADVNGETDRRKFAHYVWNAGVLMAELLGGKPDGLDWRNPERQAQRTDHRPEWWLTEEEQSQWRVEGSRVLELGAGVGLGGISSVFAGALDTVITDYPAPAILATVRRNVNANVPPSKQTSVSVEGHEWGDTTSVFTVQKAHSYSHVLAADCLWMSYEHEHLLQSMSHLLSHSSEARVHIIAGFHTGRAIVAAFFTMVSHNCDLTVEHIWECDVDGNRRLWNPDAAEEDSTTRKRWMVVATLKRGMSCASAP